jgi:hypothetical protein
VSLADQPPKHPACRARLPGWRCDMREQRHAIVVVHADAARLAYRAGRTLPPARTTGLTLARLRRANAYWRTVRAELRRELASWPESAICWLAWAGGCAPALRVSACEDPSADPRSVSSTQDHGLFQIHAPTWESAPWIDWSRIADGRYNAWVAYRISDGGRDWSAWTCGARA